MNDQVQIQALYECPATQAYVGPFVMAASYCGDGRGLQKFVPNSGHIRDKRAV